MDELPLKTISIAFVDADGHESVALFSMYLGMKLVELAKLFCIENYKEQSSQEAMVEFCVWLFISAKGKPNLEGLYFGMDRNDGVNEDFGHFVISLLSGEIDKFKERMS